MADASDAARPAPSPDATLRRRNPPSDANPPPPPPPATTRPQPQAISLRARAVAGAMGLGIVTAAVGGTYLLAENDAVFPFAVAACVATFSSVLLRFALVGVSGGGNGRPRVRHIRHHRHFTGERAAYVRTSQRLAMMDRDFTAADYEMLLDLDNNSQRLRRFLEGASHETVSRLPTFIYRDPERQTDKSDASTSVAGDEEERETPTDDGVEVDDIKAEKAANAERANDLQHITSHDSELAGATAKSCTICLEDFEDGMKIRILPCFHRFMADCIDPWLTQQAKCPVCKCSIQEVMNSLPPGMS